MGMSKEQQRAAAGRILAKEPLTEEEKVVAEMLKRDPESYEPPMADFRKCGSCGAEFRTSGEQTALQKFADHQAEHNPSPQQWGEAHKRIQAGKQRGELKEE